LLVEPPQAVPEDFLSRYRARYLSAFLCPTAALLEGLFVPYR